MSYVKDLTDTKWCFWFTHLVRTLYWDESTAYRVHYYWNYQSNTRRRCCLWQVNSSWTQRTWFLKWMRRKWNPRTTWLHRIRSTNNGEYEQTLAMSSSQIRLQHGIKNKAALLFTFIFTNAKIQQLINAKLPYSLFCIECCRLISQFGNSQL